MPVCITKPLVLQWKYDVCMIFFNESRSKYFLRNYQTLERVKKALRGLSVLGKKDWKDASRFERQLRTTPFVVVCSKNGRVLHSLLNAFRTARAKGLSTLIVDDEADQASLNTYTSRGNT